MKMTASKRLSAYFRLRYIVAAYLLSCYWHSKRKH